MTHPARTHVTTDCDGDGCAFGKRNRFFRHKKMRAEEFRLEQAYGLARRRLVNRAVLGWGVVYGFDLVGLPTTRGGCAEKPVPPPRKETATQSPQTQAAATPAPPASPASPAQATPPEAAAITVKPGLAFDQHGREIASVENTELTPANTFLWVTGVSGCATASVSTAKPGRYVLAVHYAERRMGDANLESCDCGQPEKNFVCETVVFSLRPGRCECGEPDCPDCECGCDACRSAEHSAHNCMCEWALKAKIASSPGPLCEWNGYELDPGDAVDLACVTLGSANDECKPLTFRAIDDLCGPRRLVKRNDALYDLLRGCGLTRIEKISWGQWHRNPLPMEWTAFETILGPKVEPGPNAEEATTGFHVTFSNDVQESTVTPDAFAMYCSLEDGDTGWQDWRQIVITKVIPDPPADPPIQGGAVMTRGATLVVKSTWQDEALEYRGALWNQGATFSIEIHGDYIIDCKGRAVDANARGFALYQEKENSVPAPSGNGSPGGTFVSVFRVKPGK